MGTCASVNAVQGLPLGERPKVYQPEVGGTAVFTLPSPSQTTTVRKKVLELKDATPQNLRKVFRLDFYPEVLTNKATAVTKVHQGAPSDPFLNLQANAEYEVEGVEEDEDFYNMETTQRPTMKSSDVQRALLCCEAVYLSDLQDSNAVKQLFADQRNLHDFVRVSVSRYGTVKYLLAETPDKEEVFVAFRGTADFHDVMADLSFWQESADQGGDSHNSGVGGKYHTGFMRLAFLIPAQRILEEYSNSRIVVCGHSLGGAVAHMVALNMMVHLRSRGQPVDNVKSIAFGAPYFGNDGAQQFAEKHSLSPRLLTIVNEKDPVPYILRLAETVQCTGLTLLEKVRDFSAKTRPIALSMLGILSSSGLLGPGALFVANAANSVLSQMPAKLDEYKRLLQRWGVSARDLDSLYVPLGWYLCISCSTTKAGGGAVWRRSLLTHPAAIQYTAPDVAAWREEDFQCHRVSNYRTTFFEVARKTTYEDESGSTRPKDVIFTDAIFPASIDRVCLFMTEGDPDIKQTEKCQLVIDGDNLDFLARDNPILGLPVLGGNCAVIFISRRKVALQCEVESGAFSEEASLVVRTHFQEVAVPKASFDLKRVAELPFEAKTALAVEVQAAGQSMLSQVMTTVSDTASSLVGGAAKLLGYT